VFYVFGNRRVLYFISSQFEWVFYTGIDAPFLEKVSHCKMSDSWSDSWFNYMVDNINFF